MTRKKKIILITIILVIFSSISAFITVFETNSSANENIKKLFIDEKQEKLVKKEKQDLIKIYQQDDKRCNPTQDKIDHRKEKDKVIYLSFDDGPRENTASISQILKNNGVTGTFFFTENSDNKNISNNKDVVRKVLKDGHMIGNHTYSHNYEKFYQDKNQVMPEINRNYDLLNDIAVKTIPNCKKLNHIFRFPGGSKNYFGTKSARDNIIKVLKKNKIN